MIEYESAHIGNKVIDMTRTNNKSIKHNNK